MWSSDPLLTSIHDDTTDIELAVSEKLASFGCKLTVPVFSDQVVLAKMIEMGHAHSIPSLDMHVAALIMTVWIEASAQQHIITDVMGLQAHAQAMHFDANSLQDILTMFTDLWLQRRASTVSPARPVGIPLVRVGCTKDPQHFLRQDVQHRRRAMNIDDGQVTLRHKLCRRFFDAFVKQASHFPTAMSKYVFPQPPRFTLHRRWSVTDLLIERRADCRRTVDLREVPAELSPIIATTIRIRFPRVALELESMPDKSLYTIAQAKPRPDHGVDVFAGLCCMVNGSPHVLVELSEVSKAQEVPDCMRPVWRLLARAQAAQLSEWWGSDLHAEDHKLLQGVVERVGVQEPQCEPVAVGLYRFGIDDWDCAQRLACGRVVRKRFFSAFRLLDSGAVVENQQPSRSTFNGVRSLDDLLSKRRLVEVLQHARQACAPDGQVMLDKQTIDSLSALIHFHPDAKSKIGCGIKSFTAGWWQNGRSHAFTYIVHRTCGTAAPFGVMKCFDDVIAPVKKHRSEV